MHPRRMHAGWKGVRQREKDREKPREWEAAEREKEREAGREGKREKEQRGYNIPRAYEPTVISQS